MNHLLPVVIGFLLDLCLGDPRWMPHPIIGMGRLISRLERWLRRDGQTPGEAYRAGLLLWFIVVLVSGGLCSLVIFLATAIHPIRGMAVESILCWQVLATRSLVTEARKVEQPLLHGNLPEARRAVSMIVGRDTESLSAEGVTKAGDASYGGHIHHKPFIGDPLRPIEPRDISRSCRVTVATAILSLLIFGSITYLIIH